METKNKDRIVKYEVHVVVYAVDDSEEYHSGYSQCIKDYRIHNITESEYEAGKLVNTIKDLVDRVQVD